MNHSKYLRLSSWIQNSLRRRLLFWLLPTTFLAGVLASVGTYWGAFLQLEDLLNDQIRYIATHAVIDNYHSVTLNNGPMVDEDRIIFQIWRADKLEFTTAPDIKLPPPSISGWQNISYENTILHTFVDKRNDIFIRVAQPQNERWETLAGLSVQLFWPVLSLIIILALVLWFGIGNGLDPLNKIAKELSVRNVNSMAALDVDTLPNEIKPLILSLNDLFYRLESAFIMQKYFIADAAHELRTPVMAISLQTESVQNATNDNERKLAIVQLEKGIHRLTHLIQQLLTLARLDHDNKQVMPHMVELSELCKSVIMDKYILAENKQIDLGLVSTDRIEVNGDLHMLRILLNNLVDNAIRYTPNQGQIDVSVIKQKDMVELSVRDNGPGIPEKERNRIFERFVRGNNPSDVEGSGLGLSIVKRIAEHHHATIELDTADNGKGLTVKVIFKHGVS